MRRVGRGIGWAMSALVILLITIGTIAGYGLGAGVTFAVVDGDFEGPGPFFAAVFWPLCLPAVLAYAAVRKVAERVAPPPIPKATARSTK